MDRPTALRALPLALVAGVSTDVLLRGNAWGINIVLLVGLVAAAGVAVAGRGAIGRMDRWDAWLGPTGVAFAAFIAVRADPALLLVDALLAVLATGAFIAALGGARITRGAVRHVVGACAVLCAASVAGAVTVLRAARPLTGWAGRRATLPPRALPVLRGLLLVIPILIVFAGLFAAADAVFARGLDTLLSWRLDLDLNGAAERTLVIVTVAWVVAGLLLVATGEWAPIVGDADPRTTAPVARSLGAAAATARTGLRIGEVEASVVLLAVDALFAIFVALQVAYLFGGRDTLAASGVTYANYARRGFFELLTVATLSGALVAALEATVVRRSRLYLAGALGLIALTMAVLGSSFLRLRLYQDAYGWTELRFWVLLSIGWVAISFVALTVLVIRDRSRWVLHTLAVLGVVAIGVANVLGPQAFVADRNLERALHPSLVPANGRIGLDEAYLYSLGDDAIPAIVAAYPSLAPDDRASLGPMLEDRRLALSTDPRYRGWPAWNLSRARAIDALGSFSR